MSWVSHLAHPPPPPPPPPHYRIYASMNWVSIGSNNGLSPDRRQAIIWTNAGILLIGRLGTNFIEILIEIHTFSSEKMHLKMSSGKWRPFCPGGDELTLYDCQCEGCSSGSVPSAKFVACMCTNFSMEHWTQLTQLCNIIMIEYMHYDKTVSYKPMNEFPKIKNRLHCKGAKCVKGMKRDYISRVVVWVWDVLKQHCN